MPINRIKTRIKNIFLINNKGELIEFAINKKTYNPPSKNMLLQASNGKPLIISNALEKINNMLG